MAFSMVQGQKKGTNTREQTLEMSFEKCTKNGGCIQQRGGVTIDGNWRWLHNVSYLVFDKLRHGDFMVKMKTN